MRKLDEYRTIHLKKQSHSALQKTAKMIGLPMTASIEALRLFFLKNGRAERTEKGIILRRI